jgi:hypothetical protein
MTYDLIRQAVLDRCSLTATYQRRVRHFSPHAIGRSNDGQINVMGYQYAGETSTVLPPGGEWRCFEFRLLSDVRRNGDSWHTREDHSRPNTCVTQIDAQVPH